MQSLNQQKQTKLNFRKMTSELEKEDKIEIHFNKTIKNLEDQFNRKKTKSVVTTFKDFNGIKKVPVGKFDIKCRKFVEFYNNPRYAYLTTDNVFIHCVEGVWMQQQLKKNANINIKGTTLKYLAQGATTGLLRQISGKYNTTYNNLNPNKLSKFSKLKTNRKYKKIEYDFQGLLDINPSINIQPELGQGFMDSLKNILGGVANKAGECFDKVGDMASNFGAKADSVKCMISLVLNLIICWRSKWDAITIAATFTQHLMNFGLQYEFVQKIVNFMTPYINTVTEVLKNGASYFTNLFSRNEPEWREHIDAPQESQFVQQGVEETSFFDFVKFEDDENKYYSLCKEIFGSVTFEFIQGLVTILGTIIGAMFLKKLPGQNDFFGMTKKVVALASFWKAKSTLVEMFTEIFKHVSEWIASHIFGIDVTVSEMEELVEGASKMAQEMKDLILLPDCAIKVQQDKLLADKVINTYQEAMTMYSKIGRRTGVPANAMHTFKDLLVRLERIYMNIDLTGRFNKSNRIEPLIVKFYSVPGCGKSALTYPLSIDIISASHPELGEKALDQIYNRNISQEYWDGYKGQYVTIYDDFAQVKDSKQAPNMEMMEIIRMQNLASFELHMAHLEEKGRSNFCSRLVICSSNILKHHIESLNEPSAVNRRFDYVIGVVPKQEYAKVVQISNGQKQTRMDVEKIKKDLKDGDKVLLEAYEFELYDSDTCERKCFEVNGIKKERIDYDQLLKLLTEAYNAKANECGKMREQLKRRARAAADRVMSKDVIKEEEQEFFEVEDVIYFSDDWRNFKDFLEKKDGLKATDEEQKKYIVCYKNVSMFVYPGTIQNLHTIKNNFDCVPRDPNTMDHEDEEDQQHFEFVKKTLINCDVKPIEECPIYEFQALEKTEEFKCYGEYHNDKIINLNNFVNQLGTVKKVTVSESTEEAHLSFYNTFVNNMASEIIFLPVFDDNNYGDYCMMLDNIHGMDQTIFKLFEEDGIVFKWYKIEFEAYKPTLLEKMLEKKNKVWNSFKGQLINHPIRSFIITGLSILGLVGLFVGSKWIFGKTAELTGKLKRCLWSSNKHVDHLWTEEGNIAVVDNRTGAIRKIYEPTSEDFELLKKVIPKGQIGHNVHESKEEVPRLENISELKKKQQQRKKKLEYQTNYTVEKSGMSYENNPTFEGSADPQNQEVVNKLAKNICKITLSKFIGTTRTTYSINGIAIQGGVILTNRHIEPKFDNFDKMTIEFTSSMSGNRIHHFHLKSSRGMKTYKLSPLFRKGELADAILIQLPESISHLTTMTKMFMTEFELNQLMNTKSFVGSLVIPSKYGELLHLSTRSGNMRYVGDDREVASDPRDPSLTGGLYGTVQYPADKIQTYSGDCGSVITVVGSFFQRKCFGIHAAGARNNTMNLGQIISSDMIEEALTRLDRHAITDLDLSSIIGKEPLVQQGEIQLPTPLGNFNPIGVCNEKYTFGTQTALKQTKLAGKVWEVNKKPAYLGKFEKDGEIIDLLPHNIKKCGAPAVHVDEDDLDLAARSYSQILHARKQQRYCRVLTDEEAIAGVEGDPYISGVNRKSAAGFSWSKKATGGGKSKWLGKDGEYIVDNPDLRYAMKNREELAKKNIRAPTVFIDTLKDEKRPIEKVELGKTRAFSAGQMDFTVLFRKYFSGFLANHMHNRIYNESAVGINALGTEWHELGMKMISKGDKVIAGDYSNFDGTLVRQILWKCLELINEWYQGTEEENNIRTVLFHEIVGSIHICRDILYGWTHSLPSGNPATAILNSMYNSISMRMVYKYCITDALNKGLLEPHREIVGNHFEITTSFNSFVTMIAYGDDNIVNISDVVIEAFNQETISKFYKVLGMTYTDEAKTEGFVPKFRHLKDISFLKRGFRYEIKHFRFQAPLELDSTLGMLNFYRKGKLTEDKAISCIISSCLQNLYHHGQEVYEKYRNIIIKEWENTYTDNDFERPDFYTYRFLDMMYFNDELEETLTHPED